MKSTYVVIGIALLGLVVYASGVLSPSPAVENKSTDTMKKAESEKMMPKEESKEMTKNTIVDIAVANGSFKTLVAAVQAAGLAETLSGPGPFTVFAPTDEAFAKLPAGTVEALLKDPTKLASILTYHVVPGKVMAADVVKLTTATTVQGQSVTIDATSGVMINDAKVVTPDIEASNGVIHVIDTVLLPQ